MSKYTTGEIAKLCGVSVRTVQYYDTRGILVPNELSEGGRRLYSEEDLKRMKIICFLRELDLPINSIGELLSEEHPEDVIGILLGEQEKALSEEISKKRAKLDKLEELEHSLKRVEHFSVESIGDIAHIMENKKSFVKSAPLCLPLVSLWILLRSAQFIYGAQQEYGGRLPLECVPFWQWEYGFLLSILKERHISAQNAMQCLSQPLSSHFGHRIHQIQES